MGIKQLMKLIVDEAPAAVKEHQLANYNGRIIAIDASMAIYQFLIAVRSGSDGRAATMLTNEAGEVTSHVQGMFNRTINIMEAGIKPVFVFDGKPPVFKGGELAKRYQKREKATADLAAATEAGNVEEMDRHSKRTVRATKQHSLDCKDLLKLMGVPVIDAPCEAEAQCAALAKAGKVWGVATEDMDALTFAAPRLLRKLTFGSGGSVANVVEVDLEKVLSGLKLSMDEFVDLCILCGCDYCSTIKGIGPKTALSLIRKYKCIENVLPNLNKKTNPLPPDWLNKRRKGAAADKSKEAAIEEKALKQKAAEAEEAEKKQQPVKEGDQGEAGEDKTSKATTDGGEEEQQPKEEKEAGGDEEDGQDAVKMMVDEDDDEEEAVEETDLSVVDAGPSNEEEGEDKKGEEEEEWEEQVPAYVEARRLFKEAEVAAADTVELTWKNPDEEALRTFLVDRLGFNPDRVAKGITKLKEARGKTNQKLLYSYFSASGTTQSTLGAKRKEEVSNKGNANKKAKGGGGGAKKGGGFKPRK